MKTLKAYKHNRVEKLEAIVTSVSIERRHKVFLETHGLNLSAIVRDAIDILKGDKISKIEAQARKIAQIFTAAKESPDRELENLVKLLENEDDNEGT